MCMLVMAVTETFLERLMRLISIKNFSYRYENTFLVFPPFCLVSSFSFFLAPYDESLCRRISEIIYLKKNEKCLNALEHSVTMCNIMSCCIRTHPSALQRFQLFNAFSAMLITASCSLNSSSD
jgi:hypothetical protein